MDLRDIEKAAREQGWTVGHNKKGHPTFTQPRAPFREIKASGTPSDWRSINNLLSELKRYGLVWPWTARDRRNRRKSE